VVKNDVRSVEAEGLEGLRFSAEAGFLRGTEIRVVNVVLTRFVVFVVVFVGREVVGLHSWKKASRLVFCVTEEVREIIGGWVFIVVSDKGVANLNLPTNFENSASSRISMLFS